MDGPIVAFLKGCVLMLLRQFFKEYSKRFEVILLSPYLYPFVLIAMLPFYIFVECTLTTECFFNLLAMFITSQLLTYRINKTIVKSCSQQVSQSKAWLFCIVCSGIFTIILDIFSFSINPLSCLLFLFLIIKLFRLISYLVKKTQS